MIFSECSLTEGGWWNTALYDCHDPEVEVCYLDMRGLLEHHPDHPELVRVASINACLLALANK